MNLKLKEECLKLIDFFVKEEHKDLFFNTPSMRFIKDCSEINYDYFRVCLRCISSLGKGFTTDPGSFYGVLSEDFVEYFSEDLDWKWVSSRTKLSESFVEKHIDKLNWQNMMLRQEFSEEFVERHIDKLEDYQIWVNWIYNHRSNPSKNFLLRHKDRIRKDLWDNAIIQKML